MKFTESDVRAQPSASDWIIISVIHIPSYRCDLHRTYFPKIYVSRYLDSFFYVVFSLVHILKKSDDFYRNL